jgi:hypothetical protein
MPRRAGDFGILNELYRVCAPGILGNACILKVHVLVVVQDHVSNTAPKRSAWKISGSLSGLRLIAFA